MKESRYNTWVERDGYAFVFNGLSGGLLRVSAGDRLALVNWLAGVDDMVIAPDLLEKAIRGRMIVNDDADEVAILEARYGSSRYDERRFALTIVTSLGCNFDCPYCFEAKHPSLLRDDVQAALVALVESKLIQGQNLSVTWYGGEPLVGKKALLTLSDRFLELSRRHGRDYAADIITNGSLLDRSTAEALAARNVRSAQITIDGPPDVHDRMRPLAGGGSTFWTIVNNIRAAADVLQIVVRVNIDTANFARVSELMAILADEGLAGQISMYPGQLVAIDDGVASPSASYGSKCFTNREFATAEIEFMAAAKSHGFGVWTMPEPVGAPCTAVRANELVIGSRGEIYKCWDSVGNPDDVIGNLLAPEPDVRATKWLMYDPFRDAECRGCIALPVCMGGCAHHALQDGLYDNRCGTFRHTYLERTQAFVEQMEGAGASEVLARAHAPRMETR